MQYINCRYTPVVLVLVIAAAAAPIAAAQQPGLAGVTRPKIQVLQGGTVIVGRDDRPEGRYGKVEITVAGPDRYRATLSAATGTTTQGLNGAACSCRLKCDRRTARRTTR
jgi:hypothetical protein